VGGEAAVAFVGVVAALENHAEVVADEYLPYFPLARGIDPARHFPHRMRPDGARVMTQVLFRWPMVQVDDEILIKLTWNAKELVEQRADFGAIEQDEMKKR